MQFDWVIVQLGVKGIVDTRLALAPKCRRNILYAHLNKSQLANFTNRFARSPQS